jgi:hypothetical protein
VRLPSLFIIGARDAHFDPAYVCALRDDYAERGEALVLAGADHGLEVGAWGTDVRCSLRALEQLVRAIGVFLQS